MGSNSSVPSRYDAWVDDGKGELWGGDDTRWRTVDKPEGEWEPFEAQGPKPHGRALIIGGLSVPVLVSIAAGSGALWWFTRDSGGRRRTGDRRSRRPLDHADLRTAWLHNRHYPERRGVDWTARPARPAR